MEEEVEVLCDSREATTPIKENPPNSQSDSDTMNLEDQTDWEEDNDIANLAQIPQFSSSDPLISMSRRLEEILLRPLLADHKEELVNQIMEEFWKLITINPMMRTRTNGSPSTSTTSPPLGRTTATTSKAKLNGRSREDPDDENPENEDTRGLKRPKLASSSPNCTVVSMLFACPYRKHDPRKHNIHDWSSCALTPHRSVALVKYADFTLIQIQTNIHQGSPLPIS